MVALGPALVEIDAPPQTPALEGLLRGVPVVEVGSEANALQRRFLTGIEFRPANIAALEFHEVCGTAGFDTGDFDNPGVVSVQPFVVTVRESCSTFGFSDANYVDRARAALAVREGWGVEREFEQAPLIPANPHLAELNPGQGTTQILAGGNRVSPDDAFALLDEAISNATHRIGRGVIHAPPFVFSRWGGKVRFEEPDEAEAQRGISPMGNVVVGGAGYQGANPNDGSVDDTHASQWAYATDLLAVLRDAVPFLTPPTFADAVDHQTNTVTFRISRGYAVLWPALFHAAVRVATSTATVAP